MKVKMKKRKKLNEKEKKNKEIVKSREVMEAMYTIGEHHLEVFHVRFRF